MFNQLFSRSDALTRQLSAPLVEERRQYLTQGAAEGMSEETLQTKSRLLLSIVKYLRLGQPGRDVITVSEINDAARRWSRQNRPSTKSSYVEQSRASFETQAVRWLTFINRLQARTQPITAYDHMLTEFRKFMTEDRCLSPKTVEYRCFTVRPFLDQLLDGKSSLATIAVSDVDSLLAQKVNKEHYARVSVRSYCGPQLIRPFHK